MEDLVIHGTLKSLEVKFSYKERTMLLEGRSIPEHSIEFFRPIQDWTKNLLEEAHEDTTPFTVSLKLEYFNTSSSKCILDFMKNLEEVNHNALKIQIKWYYEEDDEDMLEAGEDYKDILDIQDFELIEIEEF